VTLKADAEYQRGPHAETFDQRRWERRGQSGLIGNGLTSSDVRQLPSCTASAGGLDELPTHGASAPIFAEEERGRPPRFLTASAVPGPPGRGGTAWTRRLRRPLQCRAGKHQLHVHPRHRSAVRGRLILLGGTGAQRPSWPYSWSMPLRTPVSASPVRACTPDNRCPSHPTPCFMGISSPDASTEVPVPAGQRYGAIALQIDKMTTMSSSLDTERPTEQDDDRLT
jgi:hypothetical protein